MIQAATRDGATVAAEAPGAGAAVDHHRLPEIMGDDARPEILRGARLKADVEHTGQGRAPAVEGAGRIGDVGRIEDVGAGGRVGCHRAEALHGHRGGGMGKPGRGGRRIGLPILSRPPIETHGLIFETRRRVRRPAA
ncbi:hypothetical protein GCM10011505_37800 [Tistrella bauzanensis]|uniref:Uncharacterized protein n=1 Tax=Tistrella bauzanensis TaxID=657419 RepID=A0ABQ1IZ05_9PROT|nr:hypothetical protein [Tistrella bauzanensis]GGB53211.1 hypothetical protein GCM10011505_37800 [Tistrella bauzanensis]